MDVVKLQLNQDVGHSSQKLLSPILRVSLLVGVVVHLAGFLLFRVLSSPLPVRGETKPFVQFVSAQNLSSGAELEEQAALFDSAPLFVPGPWNAAHNLKVPQRERALQRFPAYQAEMDVAEALIPGALPLGERYDVSEPVDLLALRFWDLFSGIAVQPENVPELAEAGVAVEVRSLSGEVLLQRQADMEILSFQSIQPASFFVRIESGGRMTGRPVLESSSGDPAFDTAALDWLSQSGVAVSFPAGFLEIRIYP